MARDYIYNKHNKNVRIPGLSVSDAERASKLKEGLEEEKAKRSFWNQQSKLSKEIEQIINNGIYNPKEIIEILKEKYPDVVEEMEKVIITMPNGEQVGRLTAQILDKIKVKQKSIRKKDEGR